MPIKQENKMKSVMTHQFSQVPKANIPRSSFDRSHGHKTTFDASKLIPIYVDEALPGDTFNMKMHGFARMATPIHPLMDNLHYDVQFFSIPVRLIWDNWQKFNGEQDSPGDSTDYLVPQIIPSTFTTGTLADYFGIPIGVANLEINALHHRAYALTWNEWYRDQNLQPPVVLNKGDGPDGGSVATMAPLPRGKRHDYFTSCLPWPQKGESSSVPLGDVAPISGLGFVNTGTTQTNVTGVNETDGTSRTYPHSYQVDIASPAGANNLRVEVDATNSATPQIFADLSQATASTINQLRQAFAIQKLLERDARGGTRYIEMVKAHFGVTSPDLRATRPEFLGGGSTPINVTPIAQTSSTDTTTPQGNLSAFGTASVSGMGFTKSFTEHCILLGLCSVRGDITYSQGINKMFTRQTRYDYYWPALSTIGEQAVLNREIYATGTASDDLVFGYQERYGEYRYKPSTITGKFRTNASGSLDAWHLSQYFVTQPLLNATFIEDKTPVDRVVALPSEPNFILDTYFQLKCARPMPLYGVPGMLDHF